MLSKQEEEQERREVLENDRKVLEQRCSTFHAHAQAQADEMSQGRFAAIGAPRVVGSTPNPAAQYPAASSAHQIELPPEQAFGYSVDDMPELENPAAVSASVSPAAEPGGAAAPSAPPDVEHAPPSSNKRSE
jgi:hypothetical protein